MMPLSTRDGLLQHLRQNLLQAQNRIRQMANKKRRDVQFQIGDLVLASYNLIDKAQWPNVSTPRFVGETLALFPSLPLLDRLRTPFSYHQEARFALPSMFHYSRHSKGIHQQHVALSAKIEHIQQTNISSSGHLGFTNSSLPWRDKETNLGELVSQPSRRCNWEVLKAFSRLYNLSDLEDKVIFYGMWTGE